MDNRGKRRLLKGDEGGGSGQISGPTPNEIARANLEAMAQAGISLAEVDPAAVAAHIDGLISELQPVAGYDDAAEPLKPTIERLREFIALTDRKKGLEDAVKTIKAQLDDLEPVVLTYMQENGMQSINVDGYTVYLRRDIRASFKGTPEAFLAVENNGLSDALTTSINPQRASSIVREQIKALDLDAEIPQWLKDAFSIADGYRPGIRKA